MKYIVYFFTIVSIVLTTVPCNSMDNTQQPHQKENLQPTTNIQLPLQIEYSSEKIPFVQLITTITSPNQAQYLTEKQVIITGDNGYSIINPTTNEEIKTFAAHNCEQAIHPNKEKIALSYRECTGKKRNILKICDIKNNCTERKKETTHAIYYATFCPHEDIIFLVGNKKGHEKTYAKVAKYDWRNSTKWTWFDDHVISNIAVDPTQKIISFVKDDKNLYSYQYINTINLLAPLSKIEISKFQNSHHICKYTDDGSHIIMMSDKHLYYIDPNKDTYAHPHVTNRGKFTQLSFHPTMPVFATLTNKNDNIYIDYFNSKTLKHVSVTKLSNYVIGHDMSFCQTKVMIALRDNCIIFPVPFEIFEEQAIFLAWVLKNYQLNNPHIPHDVVRYMVTVLRQTYGA